MKNKIIFSFVLLCVIVCTTIIYHLIFDEHNTLFYINVGVSCVAEIILFLNIPILSDKKILTFKNAASTTMFNIFAMALFLWTCIFSLFVEAEGDYKILYIGILVVTAIFSLLFASVELGGNIMQKEEEKLKQLRDEKNELRNCVTMYRLEISSILDSINIEMADEVTSLLETVFDKIVTFPSEKINNNITIAINEKLEEIKLLLKAIQNDSKHEDLQSQVIQKIKYLHKYINTIKSIM